MNKDKDKTNIDKNNMKTKYANEYLREIKSLKSQLRKNLTPRINDNQATQSNSNLNISNLSNPSYLSLSERSNSNSAKLTLLHDIIVDLNTNGPSFDIYSIDQCFCLNRDQVSQLQNELLRHCTIKRIIGLEEFAKWFCIKLTYISNSCILSIRKHLKQAFDSVDRDNSKTIALEEFQQLINQVIQYYRVQLNINKQDNFKVNIHEFTNDKELQKQVEGDNVEQKLANLNVLVNKESDLTKIQIQQGNFIDYGTKYIKSIILDLYKKQFEIITKESEKKDKEIDVSIDLQNENDTKNDMQERILDENQQVHELNQSLKDELHKTKSLLKRISVNCQQYEQCNSSIQQNDKDPSTEQLIRQIQQLKVEINNYHVQINNKDIQINSDKFLIKQLNQTIESDQTKISDLHDQIDGLKFSYNESKRDMSKLMDQIIDLKSIVEHMQNEKIEFNNEININQKNLKYNQENEIKIEELQRSLKNKDNIIKNLEENNIKTEKQNSEKKKSQDNMISELQHEIRRVRQDQELIKAKSKHEQYNAQVQDENTTKFLRLETNEDDKNIDLKYQSKFNSFINSNQKEIKPIDGKETSSTYSLFGWKFDCNICERLDNQVFNDD